MDFIVEGCSDELVECLNRDRLSDCKTVSDVLLGTKCLRHGSPKDAGTVDALCDYYMRLGVPIPLVTMWGVMKGYRAGETMDMLDVFALKRYVDVQERVRQMYAPGVKVFVVVEDLTRRLKSGDTPDYTYPYSMEVFTHEWPWIEWVYESQLVGDRDVFSAQARENQRALTEAFEYDDWTEIEKLGWRGRVDWDWYLNRSANESPNKTGYQHMLQVCLYLGIALARYQFRILPEGIKASYAPYPAGTDASLYNGRIEWKAKPTKGHKSLVPWLAWMDEGLGVVGPKERRENGVTRLVRVNGYNVGILTQSTSATVREKEDTSSVGRICPMERR